MFTVKQIKTVHSKVKSGSDFPTDVQDFIKLGVTAFENYVSDGLLTIQERMIIKHHQNRSLPN